MNAPFRIYSDNALAPYLAKEREAEANREAAHRPETERSSGVCISGMGPEPFRRRPDSQILTDAIERMESAERFRASPRGRFYVCINDLRDTGAYADEAARLERWYLTSIADERSPLNVRAVAVCLGILEEIGTSTAKEGRLALEELLLAARPVDLLMAAE